MPVRLERMGRQHRLTETRQFDAVKALGLSCRGRHCTLVALRVEGQPTKLGVVASRRRLGIAVRRNRARRRLREIVRRRWAHLPHRGWWMMLVAHDSVIAATHDELVGDVIDLLRRLGVLGSTGAGRMPR